MHNQDLGSVPLQANCISAESCTKLKKTGSRRASVGEPHKHDEMGGSATWTI